MKSPARVVLVWAFVASVVLSAQSRLVPAPDATFGFKPGADFKLATYDQSIDYFRKLAAASKYVRLVEAGKTSLGRTMYFALISTPKNLDQIDRYRQIAQRLAHPPGLTDASARELAREGKAFIHIDGGLHSTEVAGAAAHAAPGLRPRQPGAGRGPGGEGDSRQRDPDAVADDQSRRPADGERVVHAERRHALRALRAAAALSGVRRARQQSRRLHAEHDRVARDRAGLARLGAEHRLRPPPVVAVSDAHLAAAVLRADRQRRAVPDVARSQHDRHGDREGPRGARAGRGDAHGHGVRRVVSRLHRLRAELQERPGLLDRDGALPVRDAARVHDRRLSRGLPRPAAPEPLPEPVAAGMVAAAAMPWTTCRRRRSPCSSTRRSTRSRCSSTATWPAAIRSPAAAAKRRSRTSSRRSSAIRWRPSSCCAGSRLAACGSRS